MYTALFKVPTLGSTHFQHIAHCTRKHEHTRTRAHCTLHTRRHPPCASSAPGFAFPSSNLNSLCLRAKTIVKHVPLKRWMSHCLHLWNLHLSAAYIRQDSHRLHHFQTHLSAGASSFATAIHEKQKVLAILFSIIHTDQECLSLQLNLVGQVQLSHFLLLLCQGLPPLLPPPQQPREQVRGWRPPVLVPEIFRACHRGAAGGGGGGGREGGGGGGGGSRPEGGGGQPGPVAQGSQLGEGGDGGKEPMVPGGE